MKKDETICIACEMIRNSPGQNPSLVPAMHTCVQIQPYAHLLDTKEFHKEYGELATEEMKLMQKKIIELQSSNTQLENNLKEARNRMLEYHLSNTKLREALEKIANLDENLACIDLKYMQAGKEIAKSALEGNKDA